MHTKLALILAAFSQLGCTRSAPPSPERASGNEADNAAGAAALSASARAVTIASAPSVPRAEPAPSAPAASSVASSQNAPARPAGVVSCEVHPKASFGAWTPTVDEVVAAIGALPKKTCLPVATRQAAVRACAAEANTPLVVISTDDFKGPSGCELQVGAAEANGRRWISFFAFYRSPGAKFDGGARVVELTSAGPKLYLDALDKHGSLCPTTGGSPLKPRELPDGWATHPQPLKDFLCAASQ